MRNNTIFKLSVVALSTAICAPVVEAASPFVSKVYEYRPAPGQFVNELPEYESGDTYQSMLEKAGEQLCGILPAVIFVFVVYLPLLFWGLVSMCHASLPRQFLKRQRRIAFVGMGVGFAMLVGCILSYDWRKSYIKICRGLARKQKNYHVIFTIQKVAAFVISTALFVVSVASVISSSHNPFIYFRF